MFDLPASPLSFIGRRAELQQLNEKIGDNRRLPKIIGITGSAGVGKTALAVEFLKQMFPRFNPIWLSPFDVDRGDESFSLVLEKVKSERRDALIVLDDIDPFERSERFARQLLGIKRLRAVIVTARKIDRAFFDVDRLGVSGLRPPEGAAFLQDQITRLDSRGLSDNQTRELEAKAEGHPLTLMMIAQLLHDHTFEQIKMRLDAGLHDLGIRLPVAEKEIVNVIAPKIIVANEALLENLKRHPEDLHQISARKFEELVAELLDDMGCEVELMPGSKDGGKDILAVMETEIGRILCLVEAKHYNPNRPVQVSLVRQLFGTYMDHGASSAMLVTSSRFTKGAREFQSRHEYQISLKEYKDVVKWIQNYKSRENTAA